MKPPISYSRRISTEEAREGYIMILKNRLSLFPPRGKPFDIKEGDVVKHASVESYSCTCQGPDLPHDHYFIRWEGLKKGMKVTLAKSETEKEYRITK
ncbi:MAG: hypothetical protein WBD36_09555 [Bacteroidota bacterium]